MVKKDLNFKSVIFKVFFTYSMVYFLALMFSHIYDIESLVNNIQYKYLMVLNMISMFLGLPLSIIFDFMLMKLFGLYYVLFFAPSLTFLSVIQVIILSKMNFKFPMNMFFSKKLKNNHILKLFENISFSSFYMMIMSSFPILPHVLGSYIIASSEIKKKIIVMNTFLGSFLYYFFLYLMIYNV